MKRTVPCNLTQVTTTNTIHYATLSFVIFIYDASTNIITLDQHILA